MKVNLAAQTITASVADAIEFCDLVLEIPAFHDSAPTVKFIRIFDHLFDILEIPMESITKAHYESQTSKHGNHS